MAKDMIRYDVLAQEAFRGLVKKVLTEVSHAGLPGDHHFFVAFDTRTPGVRLSSRLKADYPEEMTIVIQHQYRDLLVTETSFEIGLSFKGIPEKLVVPFAAIRGFFDPSVEFAVQFPLVDESGLGADVAEDGSPAKAIGSAPVSRPQPGPRAVETKPQAEAAPAADKPAAAAEDKAPAAVVSLDAFRKKT
ncbi:SspB family protein [Oryzibacter oryziterrae]|uniref:SspB family protein n=1 Tax=Oryzibacter oryziterrae TaxID=2766474 RepID=UPI001F1B6867|nr:ClpXP protease specificity-enhancing factor SspB [Oryzibacter oryziterrae]